MKTVHIAFFGIILLLTGCGKKTIQGDLIIEDINIIDVETGEVLSSQDVVITGDKISSIQPHGSVKLQAPQIVEGSNQYLIPGLWDMHVHNWWGYPDFFPLLIGNGVTGIREMWGNLPEIQRIRDLVASDSVVGPDMVTAGAIVDGNPPAWEGSDIADTPERGREIVRAQKAQGADFIKVYSLLEREVYFAIAEECKKQHIPFHGHIPQRVTLQEALEAGHGSIEHFYGFTEFGSSQYEYLVKIMKGEIENDTLMGYRTWYRLMDFIADTYDETREQALFELVEEHSPWIDPTLVVWKGAQRNFDADYPYDERIDYMPQYSYNDWRLRPEDKQDSIHRLNLETELKSYALVKKLLKPLKDNGARFLAGSDFPNPYTFPGFSIHEELRLFVQADFSPLEALQTATINPAIFLGLQDDMGTVQTGKKANLVLLAENPLEDITHTTNINAVILRGKYHQGAVLREQMEAIAAYNRMPKIKDEIWPIILEQGIDSGIVRYHELKTTKPDAYNFDEEQLNSLGYDLLEKNLTTEAVKIFEMNVAIFPQYGNGYDSLGDGYMAVGDQQKAKMAWQKAVELGNVVTQDKLQELQ